MRIAFVGAGSVEFTRKLIGDLLRFEDLGPVELALHDIDPGRLETARMIAESTVAQLGRAATVTASLDRREALAGSSYVVNMIQVGGHEATLTDFEVPARYGLRQTIADTLGVGGIFRALRTIPVMRGIVDDMQELCPDAWLLNYTNPMCMLTWSVYARTPQQRVVGLCHSIQSTTRLLARWADVPYDELTYLVAGVNHQAHVLRLEHRGDDLYPRVRERVLTDPDLARRTRVELFRRIGWFQTESSEHASEYVPWIMRHDAELERLRVPVGEYIERSEQNLVRYEEWRALAEAGGELPVLERSVEYGADIVHAIETGTPRVIYGNVRNGGAIGNLPADACVEVPCLVDRAGIQPTVVGDLPVECATLNRTFLNVCELVVQAELQERPELVVQAAMLDPNASATLTLGEIEAMCAELVAAHGDALPAWLAESDLARAARTPVLA